MNYLYLLLYLHSVSYVVVRLVFLTIRYGSIKWNLKKINNFRLIINDL